MQHKVIKKLYGVIGNPLRHSYSPAFFQEKFKEKHLDSSSYVKFELNRIEDITNVLDKNSNLRGLNVTIPYKEVIIPYLTEIDDDARNIGAVNVVKIEKDAADKLILKGYNSDWYGFKKSIETKLKPWHTKALVLGTGGASKGIIYALKQLNIEYRYVSRTAKQNCITYDDLNEDYFKQYKIIINTTPVGTFPNVKACPEIPYEYITKDHLVYDLIYNPIRSLFLHQAELKGATIYNGWEMFVYQALRSYKIWENKDWTHKF